MPARCVVAGCSNTRNLKLGIGLHTIPYYGDDRPEARKRRKKWVDFVKMKRAKWEPSQSSVICSKHFIAEDFTRRLDLNIEGQGTPLTPWLQRDDFEICAIPSIHASAIEAHSKPQSDRQRRMVRLYLFVLELISQQVLKSSTSPLNCY